MTNRWIVVASLILLALPSGSTGENTPLQTVAHVDLDRYVGKWYELARYPNRFERECDRNVTAEYSKKASGIDVVNSCVRSDGKVKRSKGLAKIQDEASNAKLAVTFFWPFYGKYWVIDLGPNYEFAVVGEPSRKYLWILSRTSSMPDDKYADIVGRLAPKGYDASKLVKTEQQ
jgi:apolipoprotein D and lipocalin family protein